MEDWGLRIYFAAAIAGGRQDRETYLLIARELQEVAEVLPEEVFDPMVNEMGELNSAAEINRRERERISRADLVVAEITQPSLGVGYQLRLAEEMGKPTLALYRPGQAISAMLLGGDIVAEPYRSVSDVRSIVIDFLRSIGKTHPLHQ